MTRILAEWTLVTGQTGQAVVKRGKIELIRMPPFFHGVRSEKVVSASSAIFALNLASPLARTGILGSAGDSCTPRGTYMICCQLHRRP